MSTNCCVWNERDSITFLFFSFHFFFFIFILLISVKRSRNQSQSVTEEIIDVLCQPRQHGLVPIVSGKATKVCETRAYNIGAETCQTRGTAGIDPRSSFISPICE